MYLSSLVLVLLQIANYPAFAYHLSPHKYTVPKQVATNNSLQLVHVLFRHGDRTPDIATIYPNDPYANETYLPYGLGQLTLEGKQRAYRLGELLRERYNELLGEMYLPDLIQARSSEYPRTRDSLALVLASLFVPTKEFLIRENLPWQPVPFDVTNRSVDNLLTTFISCEQLFHEIEDVQKTEEARQDFRKNQEFYDYITLHSGWNVNSTTLANFIHNALYTESAWGFELPKWTEKVWPDVLGEMAAKFWQYYGSTPRLRQMAVGNLINKMINDTHSKISGISPERRRMYLYSAHDFNIVPFMAALGNPIIDTPYATHILLELHRIDNEYFVKALYQDFSTTEPRVLSINGCSELCPFTMFQHLMAENIPTSTHLC